jgi:excinuclease ABC subunit A
LKYYKISATKPLSTFTEKELSIILNGSEEPIEYKVKSASGNIFNKFEYIEGVAALIKRRHLETTSEAAREYYSKYMGEITCKHCHGKKLSNIALSIKIDKKDIIDFTELPIDEAIDFLLKLKLDTVKEEIGRMAIKEIVNRLDFLKNVGLGYLTLSRNANTLSGGEAQRIRLGTQIGSSLSGVLYVLDEPSIGLHQKDNEKIIDALKKLRDAGNSILVVEHDLETIEASDYVVEIGPDAGSRGGYVTAYGTPSQIKANKNSITGKYLSNELSIPIPTSRRSGNGSVIEIKGAECNNIKNLSCVIPLGKFVCVTGVSGSGKSTLVNEIITKNILKRTSSPFVDAPKLQSIKGTKEINKVIVVSQEPIGRSPRSNPATYIGVFDDIRDLFATTNEAKARGYSKGRFSFNIPGGRCEKCQGDGVIKVKMFFLPDVYVKCDECQGKRYNDETLSILYKGKNIHDVLEMTVDVAYEFFKNVPNIEQKLKLLQQVGLGYIKLGAPSTELSGGESQRIKLAKFLQRKTNRNSILFLDEPTTGLHIHDIKKIIEVLNKIVDSGATVVVIEHNLDLIKCADYIIDMGPESGISGGKIIATGTPEQVAKKSDISYTGEYLKKLGI